MTADIIYYMHVRYFLSLVMARSATDVLYDTLHTIYVYVYTYICVSEYVYWQ